MQETPNHPNQESFFQKGIVGEGQTKPFKAHRYPEESFHIALFTETHNWGEKNNVDSYRNSQALDVPI